MGSAIRMIKRHLLQEDDVLVFLHIPKTAGTSFSSVLHQQFEDNEIANVPREIIDDAADPVKFLAPYRLITGHNQYNIHNHICKRPIFITMLRNPIERTISAYYHAQRDKNHDFHQFTYDNDLEAFLKIGLVRNSLTNLMSRYVFTDVPWYELPNHVTAINQRLESMQFVGITEFFEESLILLSYIFGWDYKRSAPKLNVATNRLPQHDIPFHVIQDIRSINKVDIEIYDSAKNRFVDQYRKFAIDRLTNHSELTPSLESAQYIKKLLMETKQLKTKIHNLETHNQRLEQLVNTPGTLNGMYRALIPLSWRLYFHNLRNGDR